MHRQLIIFLLRVTGIIAAVVACYFIGRPVMRFDNHPTDKSYYIFEGVVSIITGGMIAAMLGLAVLLVGAGLHTLWPDKSESEKQAESDREKHRQDMENPEFDPLSKIQRK